MIFEKTEIEGVFKIKIERKEDERGFFARLFSQNDFFEKSFKPSQISLSYNREKFTLRGLHFQFPHWEAKLVICAKGKIFDVAVDIRKESRYFGKWVGRTLEKWDMLFIPKGFAHGFLTLEEETEVIYLIDEPYRPEESRGIIWNDRDIGIEWPAEPKVISERDKNLPTLKEVFKKIYEIE